MKKLLFPTLLLFVIANLTAQNPKRYVFLEHYTNTVCSICATKNPILFDKIAENPDDIHHISIHPPIPYTTCEFYNDNPFENEALAITRDISGTPQLFMWGNKVNTSQLLPDAALQEGLGQTSPIRVDVTESGGVTRDVWVTINAFEDLPNESDYRLFVAMVERNVNYDAPNGESHHQNVFRKLLTSEDGLPFEQLTAGNTFDFNATYDISSNYDENEMYALAWVQIFETKEIMNSGTSSDQIVSTNELNDISISIYPNPTTSALFVEVDNLTSADVDIVDINGEIVRQIFNHQSNNSIDLSFLDSGIYFVKVDSNNSTVTQKITKL